MDLKGNWNFNFLQIVFPNNIIMKFYGHHALTSEASFDNPF